MVVSFRLVFCLGNKLWNQSVSRNGSRWLGFLIKNQNSRIIAYNIWVLLETFEREGQSPDHGEGIWGQSHTQQLGSNWEVQQGILVWHFTVYGTRSKPDYFYSSAASWSPFYRFGNWGLGFQVAVVVKNPPTNAGDGCKRLRFGPESSSLVRKIPWSRKWQPSPVFLPRESHGPRRWAIVRGVAKTQTCTNPGSEG